MKVFEDIFERVCKTLTKKRKATLTWRFASKSTIQKQFKKLKGGRFFSYIFSMRFILDAADAASEYVSGDVASCGVAHVPFILLSFGTTVVRSRLYKMLYGVVIPSRFAGGTPTIEWIYSHGHTVQVLFQPI
jgi:hypothetical protein